MNKFAALIAGGAATLGASAASAQLTGEFVLLNSAVDVFGVPAQVDVYTFDVTNNTGFDIFTLDATFIGPFVNGLQSTAATADLPQLSGFDIADTFFVGNGTAAPSTPDVIVDDGSELSGPVGINGAPWILDGSTTTIAVFSVPAGDPAPTYADNFFVDFANDTGVATVNGELVIIEDIPEPASLALLGLGGLAVAARRRRA